MESERYPGTESTVLNWHALVCSVVSRSTRCELPRELAARGISDGLIAQPVGDLGDSTHLAFRLISVQRIAELYVNITVPEPRDRHVDPARIETDEDFLQADIGYDAPSTPGSRLRVSK